MMLRGLHEHQAGEAPVARLASMIHPQAEMRLLIAFGTTLSGRDTILNALRSARRNAVLYQGRVSRFEWLGEDTVLVFGTARFALERGGHGHGSLYWLDEFRDGLIYRAHVFMREAGARRAYEERFEERSQLQ